MNEMITNRRGLLKGSAAAATLAGPFAGLIAADAAAASTNGNGEQTAPVASPYGPIAPAKCLTTGLFLLQLPRGFSYRSFSFRGDLMTDGNRVPANHDGMAVVRTLPGRANEVLLIRNQELGAGTLLNTVGNPDGIYDNVTVATGQPAGGCTVMRVRGGMLVEEYAAIGGTIVNCAGGATPWGSWITCEETETNLEAAGGKKHGYVFDVNSNPAMTDATPIVAMGRFAHEAVAFDPVTGYVYQTEDARNEAGFYRFKPNNMARAYGALFDGGTLQAAKVVGIERANFLALDGIRRSDVFKVGDSFEIEWVDIPDPDAAPGPYTESGANNPDTGTRTVSGPFRQARELGALRMSRGEGIWWSARAKGFYLTDTSFGYEATGTPPRAGRGLGAIWAYIPSRTNPERGRMILVHAPSARVAGNNVDNITISPRGGIITCDDGANVVDEFGAGQRLMGYTPAGLAYILAKSNVAFSASDIAKIGRTGQFNPGDYRGAEFAGACFDPAGRTLYVNNYTPGITFAITGPWGAGNL
jgi:hypothetical protein